MGWYAADAICLYCRNVKHTHVFTQQLWLNTQIWPHLRKVQQQKIHHLRLWCFRELQLLVHSRTYSVKHEIHSPGLFCSLKKQKLKLNTKKYAWNCLEKETSTSQGTRVWAARSVLWTVLPPKPAGEETKLLRSALVRFPRKRHSRRVGSVERFQIPTEAVEAPEWVPSSRLDPAPALVAQNVESAASLIRAFK